MKTKAEIDELKRSWLSDPIWDIEDTEGFEAQRGELAAFRMAREAEWATRRQRDHELALEELIKLVDMPAAIAEGRLTYSQVRAMAQMLLPVVQRLDRIVDDYEGRLTEAQDKIHKRERELAALHRDTIG